MHKSILRPSLLSDLSTQICRWESQEDTMPNELLLSVGQAVSLCLTSMYARALTSSLSYRSLTLGCCNPTLRYPIGSMLGSG